MVRALPLLHAMIAACVALMAVVPAGGAQPLTFGRYIVVLLPDVNPHAAAAELAQGHGLGVTHIYDAVLGGFAATIPNDAALAALRRNPRVAYVEPDQAVYASGLSTGVDRVGADDGSGFVSTGPGAPVAVLDTGIGSHAALTSVAGGFDCTGAGSYADGHGHGTHVAGTIAAHEGIGVAPGTPIYAMKVLNDNGSGSWSSVICGINKTVEWGIGVANLSLGGSSAEGDGCGSSSLHAAICDASAKGVRFAVAAGNSGVDAGGTVPTKYPEVTAVSALADSDGCLGGVGPSTDSGVDDSRADFSNFGAVIDVAAPGVGIYSTLPAGGYGTWNGTSMATPHVAALMALGGFDVEPSGFGEPIANAWGGNIACGGTIDTGDVEAPSVPTNLTASVVSSTQIDLLWAAATDNVGVVGYDVYRDGALLVTGVMGTSYADTSVSANATYTYGVSATDAAGNTSSISTPVQVTTPADADAAPSAPGNVTASKRGRAITVSWTDAATTEDGYEVYRSEGGDYVWLRDLSANATEFRDTKVSSGKTYTYAIVAFLVTSTGTTIQSTWTFSTVVKMGGPS